MNKLNSLVDILRYPLKILFVGYIMLGLGLFLQNDNFAVFYTITNPILVITSEFMVEVGAFIVRNFPLFFLIKYVSRKTNSYIPILMAIIGYATFLIATMIFASSDLPSYLFSNILNISYNRLELFSEPSLRYPIQTGLISALIVGACTKLAYKLTRRRKNLSYSLMEQDTLGIIVVVILSALCGILVAYSWSYVYDALDILYEFITLQFLQPSGMWIYGFLERLLALFGLSELIREPFWYGINGGAWTTFSGEVIVGDVNIWGAMQSANIVSSGFGRLISPYYVMNIFIYPAILIGFYSLYTDIKARAKRWLVLIFLIITSILLGALVPLELVMLFLCPLLLFVHYCLVGSIFSILSYFSANLGFVFEGNTAIALPGTLFDYAIHLRNPDIFPKLTTIAIVGIIYFVIYYILVNLYFKYMAFDIFQSGKVNNTVSLFQEIIGGYDNVEKISATPFKLIVKVRNIEAVNKERLFDLGTKRVVESNNEFNIHIGQKSTIIYRAIL